jgi:hypothetical protein
VLQDALQSSILTISRTAGAIEKRHVELTHKIVRAVRRTMPCLAPCHAAAPRARISEIIIRLSRPPVFAPSLFRMRFHS